MEDHKMAKLTTAEFIDAIKELSVLELNDLVKACEEEFGVSAAAGVVVAAAGADAGAAGADAAGTGAAGAARPDRLLLRRRSEPVFPGRNRPALISFPTNALPPRWAPSGQQRQIRLRVRTVDIRFVPHDVLGEAPSMVMPNFSMVRHRFRSSLQLSQCPQYREQSPVTLSPGFTFATFSPVFSTIPDHSCPNRMG